MYFKVFFRNITENVLFEMFSTNCQEGTHIPEQILPIKDVTSVHSTGTVYSHSFT